MMSEDHRVGDTVDEPLLLILLGERVAAAHLEAEWRQEARMVLHALAQRETTAAAPAELLALAKGLEAGLANSVADGFSG